MNSELSHHLSVTDTVTLEEVAPSRTCVRREVGLGSSWGVDGKVWNGR